MIRLRSISPDRQGRGPSWLRHPAALVRSAALVSLILGGPATAADWPTIGGSSARHGQSPEIGPSAAEDLWSGSSSGWFGGPLFTEGDRLITMRFQGTSVAPLVCHDLQTGAILWSRDFPGTNSRSVPRGFRDGKIYASNFQETGSDSLFALDPGDGHTLWFSNVRSPLGIVWSVAFASDGDLILPVSPDDIARVEHTTGQRIWLASRTIPNTGAEGICVFGNTVYGFEGSITTPKVLTAWDIETGARRYSSAALPGDGDQENPLTIGPDGTAYVLRDGGLLHALRDTGTGFAQLWAVSVDASMYMGQIGVGLDGSVYLPDGDTVVRLDPLDGSIRDRSPALVSTSTLVPRFAIGGDGNVYVGNGGSGDGAVYALTPQLTVRWSEPVPGITYGAPVLGSQGTLCVAGNGNLVKAFRSVDPAGAPTPGLETVALSLRSSPNPFVSVSRIEFDLTRLTPVSLQVVDASGREIRSLIRRSSFPAGRHQIQWQGTDDADRPVPAGVYFLVLRSEDGVIRSKTLRLR